MRLHDGRVVVITGAAGGIGREHAREFARHGARVVVNDVGPAQEVVDEIVSAGGEAVTGRVFNVKGGAISVAETWMAGPGVEQEARWAAHELALSFLSCWPRRDPTRTGPVDPVADGITVERDGTTGVVWLDRPERSNAFTYAMPSKPTAGAPSSGASSLPIGIAVLTV